MDLPAAPKFFPILIASCFIFQSNFGYSIPTKETVTLDSVPQPPNNLLTTALSSNRVELSWQDNSSDETDFEIWRSDSPGVDSTRISSLPANTTTFTNEGLEAGTTYSYYVVAVSNGFSSDPSNKSTVTTPASFPGETTFNYNALHNGNIAAVKWKNHGDEEKIYTYHYDVLNRLKSAHYGKWDGTGWSNSQGGFNIPQISYDRNGNIARLDRQEVNANDLAIYSDQLIYEYEGNQLREISDQTPNDHGFLDGNTAGIDYAYDVQGNMTQDLNKGIVNITYNHLNLPELITKEDGQRIQYIYDASGVKLAQEVYDAGNNLIKRTDYMGEFVYEDGDLKFIQHEEGKVLSTNNDWEYQYDLKDHLDNVRLTFTTKPDITNTIATNETANQDPERAQFLYYDDVTKINATIFDHTNNGDTHYSVRLNGTANEQTGLAKSLQVMAGDTVKMDVYAKYLDPNTNNWTTALADLISSIASGSAPPGVIVDGASSGATAGFPFAGLFDNSNDNSQGPKAYLNWLVFDKNFTLVDGGYRPVTDAAIESGAGVPHEQLAAEITIAQAGYVYIYLSNENPIPVEVYFDDFSVEHIQTPVLQVDDYYPGGLTFNGVKKNDFEYEGTYKNNGLGWKDLGFRQYEPATGRFHVIDPLAELQIEQSTYQYAGNNPVNNQDILGLFVDEDDEVDDDEDEEDTFKDPVDPKKKAQKMGKKKAKAKKRQANSRAGLNLKGQTNNSRKRPSLSKRNNKAEERKNQDQQSSNSNDSKDDSNEEMIVSFGDIAHRETQSRFGEVFDPLPPQKEGSTPGNPFSNVDRNPRFNSGSNLRGTSAPMMGNPTQLGKWWDQSQRANNLEKLRQELYGNLPYLQALALYSLKLIIDEESATTPDVRRVRQMASRKDDSQSNDFELQTLDPPPTSTSDEALAVLPASLEQSEHFSNVDPDEFLSQLRERVSEGGHEGTNQGAGTNFCWSAATAKHVYENDPEGMADAMIGLYENGTFEYDNNNGGLSIPEPSQEVRDAIGSEVFDDNQDQDAGQTINELDQMLFMTMADHYDHSYLNILDPDYDPGDEEFPLWSGAPLSKATKVWRDFGYDVKVQGYDLGWANTDKLDIVREALETNDVVLFVNSGSFKENDQLSNLTGTHYIHIASIEQDGDKYKIEYWDYGGLRNIRMSETQFLQAVYGMIKIPTNE